MIRKLALVAATMAMTAGAVWLAAPSRALADTGTTKMDSTAAAPVTADEAAMAAKVQDMTIGNPDAKVSVIEYLSFTCPHCEEFHCDGLSADQEELHRHRQDQFTIREVYFDKYGLWAGMMARCGGEMRYFGIVDILYDTQRQWAGAERPERGGGEPEEDRQDGRA